MQYKSTIRREVNVGKYLTLMAGLWYCLLRGGVNADVAGVIAARAAPACYPWPISRWDSAIKLEK